ncbi:MAG TPA: hypothetical protein PK970_03165 [Hyphomicrobiaceae bacterium]|nr:hypothetical protein [Hyphomicrobiaceae bacterium]
MTDTIGLFPAYLLAIPVFIVLVLLTAFSRFITSIRDLVVILHGMTALQRIVTASIIGAVVVAIVISGAIRTSSHKEIVRQQLHLPPSIAFDEFESRYASRHKFQNERIEAIVRFSESEFQAYRAIVDDESVWMPFPVVYNGDVIPVTFEAGALTWRVAPRPAFAGNVRVRWGNLSREQEPHARNRKTLCYAVLQIAPAGRQGSNGSGAPNHIARACSDFARTDKIRFYFLAVLDYDTRSLHVILN